MERLKQKRKQKPKRGESLSNLFALAYDVVAPYSVDECVTRLQSLQTDANLFQEVTTVDVIYGDSDRQLIVIDIRKFYRGIAIAQVIVLPSYHQEDLSLLKLQSTFAQIPYGYLVVAVIVFAVISFREPSFWFGVALFVGVLPFLWLYTIRERDKLVDLIMTSLNASIPEQPDVAAL